MKSTEYRCSVDCVQGAFQVEENYGCRDTFCEGRFKQLAKGKNLVDAFLTSAKFDLLLADVTFASWCQVAQYY